MVRSVESHPQEERSIVLIVVNELCGPHSDVGVQMAVVRKVGGHRTKFVAETRQGVAGCILEPSPADLLLKLGWISDRVVFELFGPHASDRLGLSVFKG